ncbi:F0F1 ATP synthase subunit gamma [Lacticaseibacillus sharpeae]|uniref:ATP synthase gamma chain n=1 Tax=Lacticaseibacillus sharpeae JCM 1186 = DSM 20505 TaxID=1291052 RepID=A0A0R1ZNC9_9LACO|nr:F0F1 ATP synthase subunit gamma [Lacticaseibacillus sharpeae]KRM56535.1 F0F1-type ATP synthase, gamma subunit [Lacticaseibacillus sharpeae JCM 1186 = DSM 20505]
MADSLIDIKRRIASTKKTRQITAAMQMVSGAKLSQVEKKSGAYQIYADKIRETVTHLAQSQLLSMAANRDYNNRDDNDKAGDMRVRVSDLLQERPVKKVGYLVMTSDRGLVGSYNSNVLKPMLDVLKDDEHPSTVLAVGGVGADFFKARNVSVAYEYRGISDVPTFNEVREIVKTAVSMYDNEVFDELYVCYNHHVNSLTSVFRVEKMLPINDLDPAEVEDTPVSYLTEPDVDAVLDAVLPQYAESLIFGAIMDAKTAEHAASMTAMKSATDNADNLIGDLSTRYNRARQAQITTELTEIVSGAAAVE